MSVNTWVLTFHMPRIQQDYCWPRKHQTNFRVIEILDDQWSNDLTCIFDQISQHRSIQSQVNSYPELLAFCDFVGEVMQGVAGVGVKVLQVLQFANFGRNRSQTSAIQHEILQVRQFPWKVSPMASSPQEISRFQCDLEFMIRNRNFSQKWLWGLLTYFRRQCGLAVAG